MHPGDRRARRLPRRRRGIGRYQLNAAVCSRVRGPQEASAIIAVEISSRKSPVAALEKRWDRLRAGRDLMLDQQGADMADLPGGPAGCWGAATRGRKLIGW